jgi:phage baseplate assembly protein W
VVIVGISNHADKARRLFREADNKNIISRELNNINAYLIDAPNIEVKATNGPLCDRFLMQFGNHPYYGSALIFSVQESRHIITEEPKGSRFIRPLYGSKEFISASPRACLWIREEDVNTALEIPRIAAKLEEVSKSRRAAKQDKAAQKLANTPYRFRDQFVAQSHTIVIPRISSENRPFLPVGLLPAYAIVQEKAFALYDAPLWNMANRLTPSLGLDWYSLCPHENRFFLLQHPRLEHLPRPHFNGTKQNRYDPLRGRNPINTGALFPRYDRGYV